MSACPFAQRALAQAFTRRPGGRNGVRGGQMEFWGQPPLSGPSTLDATGYKSLIEAVRSACDAGDLSPPTLCRLGFHSVHIAMSAGRSWGANGGFHAYDVDHWDSGNAGIEDDISFLLQLRKERFSGITHADLFTLVGSLGPELAGGPPIAWYPGRLDSTGPGPSQPPLSAALPDGMLNATGVQTNYEMILGLTPREQVIFTGGGHSFGGAEVDASGWNGSFTGEDKWPTPPNKYFIELMENDDWTVVVNEKSGKPQYVRAADAGKQPSEDTILRLPSDYAMKEADVFSKWCNLYAADEAVFTSDFQRTYQRAMQLGAGRVYKLMPEVFMWQGFAGTFEGFGTSITPLEDGCADE